jgi:hypothetical protein
MGSMVISSRIAAPHCGHAGPDLSLLLSLLTSDTTRRPSRPGCCERGNPLPATHERQVGCGSAHILWTRREKDGELRFTHPPYAAASPPLRHPDPRIHEPPVEPHVGQAARPRHPCPHSGPRLPPSPGLLRLDLVQPQRKARRRLAPRRDRDPRALPAHGLHGLRPDRRRGAAGLVAGHRTAPARLARGDELAFLVLPRSLRRMRFSAASR